MSPIITPISTEASRRTAVEVESAVATRRSVEQAPLRSAAVRDISDIENGDFFPTLDAVTRRILKAMYDALEKAANQAEERLRAEQRQQAADAARQAAVQNEQAVKAQERQQIEIELTQQQARRAEPREAPQIAGTNAGEAEGSEFRVPGSAEQDAPAQTDKVSVGPVSNGNDAQATVQKIKQILVKTSPPNIARLHQFISTPPPAPAPVPAPAPATLQAPVASIPPGGASTAYA
jgi:hypothetical protein